jgi:hypothetical protein
MEAVSESEFCSEAVLKWTTRFDASLIVWTKRRGKVLFRLLVYTWGLK